MVEYYIVKRDGTKVPFDKDKIIAAISAAFIEVEGDCYHDAFVEQIATDIEETVKASPMLIDVETIQNWVENDLMHSEYADVARAYVRYRYKKEIAREVKSDFFDAIGEKLEARDVQNQNANVDEHSFGGRIGEAASVMTKQYALNYLVSPMARKNHEGNMVYIHDLDHYATGDHNCLSIPFDDLLANGFNTRQTDVRPANSVNTAFQLVAVIFQLQSLQQFGGVAATHLDWTLVPYVRKSFVKYIEDGLVYIEGKSEYKAKRFRKWLAHDEAHPDSLIHFDDKEFRELHPDAWEYAMDMTEREVRQGAEGLFHNLNTLQSRSGNQLPFTSVNFGTCTLPEGRMVTKALLDVSIEGLGKLHKTSIFPCQIFQCMKGVNREPGDPNYDLYQLALESTAKRLYPNYANVDWSGNAGYDKNDPRTYFSTMGKRKLQLM